MKRLLAPESIAIVGLSADPAKHGGRVLANLVKLGYGGRIHGVNPRLPEVDGVEHMVAGLSDLPEPPDLVVCAVPASVIPGVVTEADAVGAGCVVVFAGGFAETGPDGVTLQHSLGGRSVRILGPNSGGVIRPAVGLAASFLTCLDRPADQIRSGPVGLVTQSGGTGSYIHNLAAAAGGGLAASISVGNEADIGLADGIDALVELDDVRAIAVVMETVRDGEAFMAAVRRAKRLGRSVVVCRLGTSRRGERLMSTHTGAMAVPGAVLDGVLDSLGVTIAETPQELYEIAEVQARLPELGGSRVGVVTHSGGMAILLSDLADRAGLQLPQPGDRLTMALRPLLELGATDNPLDMGGIIGGPGRYAETVGQFATSGEVDVVLAVSSAHPPAHTAERVRGLLALETPVPVVHLWMAGDLAENGLAQLRRAGVPVIVEPRAVVRALAGVTRPTLGDQPTAIAPSEPLEMVPRTEFETKALLRSWGIPVVEGRLARSADEAALIAADLRGRVACKISALAIVHKTEVDGVVLGVEGPDACRAVFNQIVERVRSTAPDVEIDGVLVERMLPGVEVILGFIHDQVFGPMTLLGLGGVAVEGLGTEALTPAPVSTAGARRLIERVAGLGTSLARASVAPSALVELEEIVSEASRRFVGSGLQELEINPLAATAEGWIALDALALSGHARASRSTDRHGAERM